MSAPTWYDVLGVDRDATTDEIREAWKRGIGDLDPTDRRFRSLSDAAAVLLDARRRAEYDATLPPEDEAAPEAPPGPVVEPDEGVGPTHGKGASADWVVGATPLGPSSESDSSVDRAPADGPNGVAPTSDVGGRPPSRGPDPEEPLSGATTDPDTGSATATSSRRRVPVVSGWVLIVLAVVAAACVAAAGLSLSKSGQVDALRTVTVGNDNSSVAVGGQDAGKTITYNHTTLVESDGAAALAAAKTAIVPVLSYDWRHMQQSKTAAEAYMTDRYKQKSYGPIFAMIEKNVPTTHTVVKAEPPLDAGIVGVSPGVVQVLLFVDCPTTNANAKKPIPYQDQVTVTMVKVGDQWLVDGLRTTPAGS